jgi:cell division protein FtsW
MADQPIVPSYVDMTDAAVPGVDLGRRAKRPVTGTSRPVAGDSARPTERKRTFLASLDTPVVIVISILLALGLMMVYSTTFDWSYQEYGSESTIFMTHVRNVLIGLGVLVVTTLIDYRLWKRFAVVVLLVTFALLVGVLLFGDNTFGARRAFFNGSYQPGEMAELTTIIYLSAWLGSKNARVRSFTYGFLPFGVLVGVTIYLVYLQPDISTAAMIGLVGGVLFFLAGARWLHIVLGIAAAALAGVFILSNSSLGYAQDRVDTYISGAADLTQANYHVQQAVIAFMNGGWTGVGLGEGKQKFGFLPAPHTDSIFAVIGEELGFVGASLVVILYIVLVMRGLAIARRAPDLYGALLASGITIWIAAKALLNIAVMTAVLPATGAPLPFVSFGGSSLVVLMGGAGLLLSVARINSRTRAPDWRNHSASVDRSGGNGRERLPRAGRGRGDTKPKARHIS